jgi:ankyrin repeat protein
MSRLLKFIVVRSYACAVAGILVLSTLAAADLRLVDAAKNGDKSAIANLLKEHVDVNAAQGDGATPLAWAAHQDDLETAGLLIAASADVNKANDYGVTPLLLACENGSAAMGAILLKAGADPNLARPTGQTPLMTASRTGNLELVKLLLAARANVNAKDNHRGQTALMWAVAERHPEIVLELIAHGADVQAKTSGGFTALLFAAQQGDLDTARMLLAAGAKVNEASPEFGNALIVATASGHEDFALFLLNHDADPNATDAYGITALHYCVHRGLSLLRGVRFEPTLTYLFRPNMPKLAEALLVHGANPNARIAKAPPMPAARRLPVISVVGATPYMLAATSYDAPMMRLLVAHGANPRILTKENTTALILAAGMAEGLSYLPQRTEEDDRHALEAVKLAVELGDDVNAANDARETAVHAAAYVGSDAIIQFLVEKGAKLEVKDSSGQTPLSIAAKEFPPTLLDDNLRPQFVHQSTVELLHKLGARPIALRRTPVEAPAKP